MTTRFLPSRVLPLFSLAVLAACGSPAAPVVPAPPPPATAQVAKEPPIDVSPVPDPPALVLIARVNKPDAILKTVGDWTHLPLPGARDLARSAVSDALADSIDFTQPVDAAVTVSMSRHGVDPLAAFSIGIKSFDDARSKIGAKYKMDPVTNGGFKIHGLLSKNPPAQDPSAGDRGGPTGDNDDDGDVCVLAHAATGAKLVCGPNGAVDALTPYLSRTLPRQSWPADVHVEIRPDPVRGPVQEMRGALPMLAHNFFGSSSQSVRDLIDASVGEAVDILDDSQKLTLDATINDRGVVATSRFEFQGNKSLLARMLTDTSRADVAPAAFWHLPAETDTAFFMRGADAKLYEHPREILTNLMMEGMDSAGMPATEKKAVHDLVADRMLKVFTDGGIGIYAKGFDQAALEKAMRARESMKDLDWNGEQEQKRIIGEQVVGWHLYEVSEPIAQVAPILKDWSSLWNRPAFAKWIETKTGTDKKEMPRMRIAPMPAGVTLPKDAVHLEVTIPPDPQPQWSMTPPPPPPMRPGGKPGPVVKAPPPPKKSPPPKAIVIHIYAVPDGSNTWLAFGVDGKLVGTKVAQALSSAPDANTLGKVNGLEALREGKINGGGFATMRGFLVVGALDRGEHSPFSTMLTLPKKGATPIVLSSSAEPGSPTARAGASVGTLRVSREVIEDMVKMVFAMHM